MPGMTMSSAPGIAFAVARPPETSISGSSSPWITSAGARTDARSLVRSPDASDGKKLPGEADGAITAVEALLAELPDPVLVGRVSG